MIQRVKAYVEENGRPEGASIFLEEQGSSMSDDDHRYSTSESVNTRGIYTIDGGNDVALTSGTPVQHLASLQDILGETSFDTTANPEIVQWTE
uniref:Uncharacterized protein n=1 Tax=Leersia perrieri TaxID=77586 RepID=A0A0D9XRJ9_9ORYZ